MTNHTYSYPLWSNILDNGILCKNTNLKSKAHTMILLISVILNCNYLHLNPEQAIAINEPLQYDNWTLGDTAYLHNILIYFSK